MLDYVFSGFGKNTGEASGPVPICRQFLPCPKAAEMTMHFPRPGQTALHILGLV